jgi:hypothetical protein
MTKFQDFINFDYFITKDVISIIYCLGAILITIIGFVIMIGGQVPGAIYNDAFSAIIAGGAIIILGNLLWRIICEFIAVVFKINNSLISIDDSIETDEETDEETEKKTT